jgi:hypothetical protein
MCGMLSLERIKEARRLTVRVWSNSAIEMSAMLGMRLP